MQKRYLLYIDHKYLPLRLLSLLENEGIYEKLLNSDVINIGK